MNDERLNIVITGALGRMGRALAHFAAASDDIELTGATERYDHELLAQDVGLLLLGKASGVTLENDLANVIVGAKAVIDFTFPEASVNHARVAARYHLPLVIGTTGLTAEHRDAIAEAAADAPIVVAPNMSIGVNVLFHLARRAARALGEDMDIEIVETHHRDKVDAPSGTALRLAEIVGEELGYDNPEDYFIHGRVGHTGARPGGRIGLHAVRGGGVVGSHDLHFLGAAESLTLRHEALSRENFVRGAIRAAFWLQGKEPGLYDMGDVLGLK